MTDSKKPSKADDRDQLLGTTYARIVNCAPDKTGCWMLVDTEGQRLFLVRERRVLADWPVSTALVGLDNREDSGGTPCGVHLVAGKIGNHCPVGTVFVSREPTGEVWNPSWNQDPDLRRRDFILSRILILDGLETGVNRGPGIDSRQRYIYVHGTNREDLIGQPVSGGCVRMTNRDIIELFERIEEGDPLVIV